MKAQLTFNLPEEDVEFKQAVDGHKWESVVWNIQQACMKHGRFYDRPTISLLDVMRLINEEMDEKNLEFSP